MKIDKAYSSGDNGGMQELLGYIKNYILTKLAAKQNTLTFDDNPTQNSGNPVKSGGIYSGLASKANASTVQEIALDVGELSASVLLKADKVTNATSGHLAGLDANGNLTDSGVSPTEDVTVEGNPVTFDSPFEQDAKSVVVSVKPIQDLHGYDHPWAGGTNVNLYDCTISESTTFDVTFSNVSDADGNKLGVKAKGLSSGYAQYNVDCPLKAGTYKTFATGISNNFSFNVRNANGSWLAEPGASFTLAEDTTIKIRYFVNEGFNADDIIYCMVYKYSGTDVTAFSPYSNECPISGIDEVEIGVSDGESAPTTTTIPLPSTLYGGTVDLESGKLTIDKGFVTFDGSEDEAWARYESGSASGFAMQTVLSNFSGIANTQDDIAGNYLQTISANATWGNYDSWISAYGVRNSFATGVKSITTIEAWRAYLAEHPLTVTYKLATPTTLSLTPTDVELLEGTNVVTTNGEKVAVTYKAGILATLGDIDGLNDKVKTKLDKKDVAKVEGANASKAYAVGDYMLRSDGFYVVTQAIAQNAPITSNNTDKTTVGNELSNKANINDISGKRDILFKKYQTGNIVDVTWYRLFTLKCTSYNFVHIRLVVKTGYNPMLEVFLSIRYTPNGVDGNNTYMRAISTGSFLNIRMYKVDDNTIGIAALVNGSYSTVGFEVLDMASESESITVDNIQTDSNFQSITEPSSFGIITLISGDYNDLINKPTVPTWTKLGEVTGTSPDYENSSTFNLSALQNKDVLMIFSVEEGVLTAKQGIITLEYSAFEFGKILQDSVQEEDEITRLWKGFYGGGPRMSVATFEEVMQSIAYIYIATHSSTADIGAKLYGGYNWTLEIYTK